ncbi:MAG TPA: hypothetical protein VIE65_05645, partial [Methylobacter sp.]
MTLILMSSLLSRQLAYLLHPCSRSHRFPTDCDTSAIPGSRMNTQTCKVRVWVQIMSVAFLAATFSCAAWASAQLNNPYSEDEGEQAVLYESFSERPKHMDPAVAYNAT